MASGLAVLFFVKRCKFHRLESTVTDLAEVGVSGVLQTQHRSGVFRTSCLHHPIGSIRPLCIITHQSASCFILCSGYFTSRAHVPVNRPRHISALKSRNGQHLALARIMGMASKLCYSPAWFTTFICQDAIDTMENPMFMVCPNTKALGITQMLFAQFPTLADTMLRPSSWQNGALSSSTVTELAVRVQAEPNDMLLAGRVLCNELP